MTMRAEFYQIRCHREGNCEFMSKAVKEAEMLPRLGDKNPDNPRQVWVRCDMCHIERYVEIYWHIQKEVESCGWIKHCLSCAMKIKEQGRRENPIVTLPTGSTVFLNVRHPNDPNYVMVKCGICEQEHYEHRRPWRRSREIWKGFCEDCEPWARVAMRPEHVSAASAERHAIYAKIRELRHSFETKATQTPKGAKMPFCVLAKKWDEANTQAITNTRDTQSYNVRRLSLYFGTKPIGEFNLEEGLQFRQFLVELKPLRGAPRTYRSELAVNQTLQVLRRIFAFAWERRWISKNPFSGEGAPLTPYPKRITAKRKVGAPKGSGAVITEAALVQAFKQLGSYATQEEVAEFLDVTDRAIRNWQTDNELTWRKAQERYSRTGSELSGI